MKNIEKALTTYAKGKGPKVSYSFLCAKAEENSKELIDIHFKLITDEIDHLESTRSTDKVLVLLENLNVMITNCDSIDRGIINRGLQKTVERIDRIKIEKRRKIENFGLLTKKLDKITTSLEKVKEVNTEKENKPYDLMLFLINVTKNLDFIEYTLRKMPNLVNAKDKDQVSLFRTVMREYFDNIINYDDENLYYYSSVISLMIAQEKFNVTTNEKNKIINEIYNFIDKISANKRDRKKNKKKIEWLNNVINIVKGLEDSQKDIESIAVKYNIPVYFDEVIKKEAKMAKLPKGEEEDRYYVDDYIISIDGPGVVEIDDAVSCKQLENGNYLLGVHIASVLSYFPYESDIIKTALSRVKSIYLDRKYQFEEDEYKRVVPTLPYAFSAVTGSLVPDVPKYARSYYFEIAKDGEIVNEKFYKSVIKSNRKSSYNEIDKILKFGTTSEPLQKTITALSEVCEILDKKYKPTYLYEKIKENNKDSSDLRVKRQGAEKIIYLSMLLTGNRVAEYFANSKREYPCLYRVHEVNEANNKKLEAMIESLTKTYGGNQYQKLYQLISGIYPKGWYALEGSHSGLDLDHYCHCTSGLRRSADIVVEHALNVCYDNNPSDLQLARLEKEIQARALEINSRLDPIDWFTKDYARTYQKKR